MTNLTRGERFKDARTDHNQHGKQTLKEVQKATGVTASLIQDLEDDEKKRSVGYDKVVTLAEHYGVSTDFLLGLTDFPTTNETLRGVCDYTGLSEEAIVNLRALACCGVMQQDFVRRFVEQIVCNSPMIDQLAVNSVEAKCIALRQTDEQRQRAEARPLIDNYISSMTCDGDGAFKISADMASDFFREKAVEKVTSTVRYLLGEMIDTAVQDRLSKPSYKKGDFKWVEEEEEDDNGQFNADEDQ